MEKEHRALMYAFLSRLFARSLDEAVIRELQSNEAMMGLFLEKTAQTWFTTTPMPELLEILNVEYHSLFLMHSLPIESSILDNKEEVLVGLQNPVMQFYFEQGYSLHLSQSSQLAPDHISLECAFMQNAIENDETRVQKAFLEQHLLPWAPLYLQSMASMAQTPFYKGICEMGAEFFLADYETVC